MIRITTLAAVSLLSLVILAANDAQACMKAQILLPESTPRVMVVVNKPKLLKPVVMERTRGMAVQHRKLPAARLR